MLPPTNVKQVRSFIGMCSWHRRFVVAFSRVAEPIVALTKKYTKFNWTTECQKAFDSLEKSLSAVPLLAYPDTNKPYVLYTDASQPALARAWYDSVMSR